MVQNRKVTVFGATGNVGKELLPFLSQAGVSTIAVTRDKARAKALPSVTWMEADMADRQSLHKTMDSSRAVFLASGLGEGFVEEQANVAGIAKAQGVEQIVKLSMNGVAEDSPFYIAALNYRAEEAVKAAGPGWTMLRPHSFMQNWLRPDFANTVRQERKIIEATGDGTKPFIDTRDIAEVAFRILTSPDGHAGQAYELTADEAVNYSQVAEAIGKAIGENVEFVPLTSEEARQRMEKRGVPPFLIHTFIAIAEGQRDGKADFTTSSVRDILGKPSRTVEGFANDYADIFR